MRLQSVSNSGRKWRETKGMQDEALDVDIRCYTRIAILSNNAAKEQLSPNAWTQYCH